MALRAPGFWQGRPGVMSGLLAPLGGLYAAGTARKLRRGARSDPGVPVICVGNLSAGGTGKTPVTMALAQHLSGTGVHILSRGFGGAETGPLRVDPARHRAAQVGDEPLLLSGFAPVWIARDRAQGAKAAVADGAGLLVLDDGFQNAALSYDLSIVVVDAAMGFGNGRVIPAGPLREPVAAGLARADLMITIGPDAAQDRFTESWGHEITLPRIKAHLAPLPMGIDFTGQPVVAFAGIGRPEKFFDTLRGIGADLRRTIALGDHQSLPPALMTRIETEAKATGALIVTTEKDAARLPQSFRQKVLTLPVRLQMEDAQVLWDRVDPLLEVSPGES